MYNKVTLGQLQKITPHVSAPRPGRWVMLGAGMAGHLLSVCPRSSMTPHVRVPLLTLLAVSCFSAFGPAVAVEVAAGSNLPGGLL